jgi:5'-nucleotidase
MSRLIPPLAGSPAVVPRKRDFGDEDVAGPRILITNDDGIHGPGIVLLEKIAATLSDDVWVVAPEVEQSGASHSLSLANPIRLREDEPRRFAVQGTPTDCVVIASNYVLKDKRPDLLLSGINRGLNLAEDIMYSGTVAAAMEGTLLGVKSVALSQCFTPNSPVPWETGERHLPRILRHLMTVDLPKGVLVNINVPAAAPDEVTGLRVTRQGVRTKLEIRTDDRIDARGFPYFWLKFHREVGDPRSDSDLAAIEAKAVSVTPLHLDLTNHETIPALRDALAGVKLEGLAR